MSDQPHDIEAAHWGTGGDRDKNITDAILMCAVGLGAIATALNRIADMRIDHPLMGETFGGIEAALSEIADAVAAVEIISDEPKRDPDKA